MRRFLLSSLLLVGAASVGNAQDSSGTLRGVYGPPESASGSLRGVTDVPRPTPFPSLPKAVAAPDYGGSDRGPDVSIQGDVRPGEALPEGVRPSPIAGRSGYGRVVINGRPAIVDMSNRRVVQIGD